MIDLLIQSSFHSFGSYSEEGATILIQAMMYVALAVAVRVVRPSFMKLCLNSQPASREGWLLVVHGVESCRNLVRAHLLHSPVLPHPADRASGAWMVSLFAWFRRALLRRHRRVSSSATVGADAVGGRGGCSAGDGMAMVLRRPCESLSSLCVFVWLCTGSMDVVDQSGWIPD